MVAVERELGSGQGDIMTRTPNSNHTWSSGIGYDVASLPGIGSDVVLTPGNFQAYPEFHFYTQAPGSCVLGCKHQESWPFSGPLVALPLTTFLLH